MKNASEYLTPFSYFKGGIKKKIASGEITHAQYIETVTGIGDYVLEDGSLPDKITNVRKIYIQVRAGRRPASDYDAAKAALPWVLPQGRIVRRRQPGELWKHVGFEPSGIFNLDVDVKDNRDTQLCIDAGIDPQDDSLAADVLRAEVIREALILAGLPWMLDIALSPSSMGYKVNAIVVKFSADDAAMARHTLDTLGKAIEEEAGVRIDYGVKSCWPCYLTHDPDMWVNPDPEIWTSDEKEVEIARRKRQHVNAPDMGLCDPELVSEALEHWRRAGAFDRSGEPVLGDDGLLHHDAHRNIIWGVVHAVGYDRAQDLLEEIDFPAICSSSLKLRKIIEDYRHAPGADTAPVTWDALWPMYGIPTAMAMPDFDPIDESDLGDPPGTPAVFAEHIERQQVDQILQTVETETAPRPAIDRKEVRKQVESLPVAPRETVELKKVTVTEDDEEFETLELPDEFLSYKGPEKLSQEDINAVEKILKQTGSCADGMPTYVSENVNEFLQSTFTDGKSFYELVTDPHDPDGRRVAQGISLHLLQCKMERMEIPRDPPALRPRLLDRVNEFHRIDGMAPVHFSTEGIVHFEGKKILNNSTMRLVEPLPWKLKTRRVEFGEGFPKVAKQMAWMFNSTPKAVQERQLERILFFMSHDYKGCYYGNPKKGLMLGLVGPVNCGKTYFTRAVFGGLMGGAADKAENYFARLDTSNKDTLSRSIIMVDDRPRLHRDKERFFLEAIKQFVSTGTLFYRSFYNDFITVPAGGSRLIIALNDDPESLQVLPQLGKSMIDKVLFLKLQPPDYPFDFPSEDEIKEELPGLGRYLLQYEPPEDLIGIRYGQIHFTSSGLTLYSKSDTRVESVALMLEDLIVRCVNEGLIEGWKSGAPDYHKGIGFYRGVKSQGRLWLAITGALFRDFYRHSNGNSANLDHANFQLKTLASQPESPIILPNEQLRAQTPVKDSWTDMEGGIFRNLRAKLFIDVDRYWVQLYGKALPEAEEEIFKL